jgi:hypothetical protein
MQLDDVVGAESMHVRVMVMVRRSRRW